MYASTGIDTDLCGKCFAVCAYTQRYLRSGYHSRSEFHRNAIFLRKFKKPLDKPPHIWYNIKVIDQWRSRLVGRGRTTGNRVGLKRVSRVRISASPPKHLIFIGCFFLSPSVRKRHIIEFDSLIVFADAFVFNIPERHRRDARAFFAYYAMTGRAIPKVQ